MQTYCSKVCSCGEDLDSVLESAIEAVKTVEELDAKVREMGGQSAISAISITEAADGTVTMVNTLSTGGTETIVISPDANGNPGSITYNGTAIPIEWVVSA